MKILILGKGWVGSICKEKWGDEAIVSDKRINSKQDALDIIDEVKPDVVLNTAGVTGKPNVDWCETNQIKTILGNIKKTDYINLFVSQLKDTSSS